AVLWENGDADLKEAVQKLAVIFIAARKTLADPAAPQANRALAMRLLGRGFDQHAEDRKILTGFLAPQQPDDLQRAAAASLGQLKDPAVLDALVRGWKTYSPALRGQVLDALLARPDGVQATLTALDAKKILPLEIDAARRQRLLDHKDKA